MATAERTYTASQIYGPDWITGSAPGDVRAVVAHIKRVLTSRTALHYAPRHSRYVVRIAGERTRVVRANS